MKIAIPLFGKRISPYFDYAQSAMLITTDGGKVIDEREISLAGWDPLQRVSCLKEMGVTTLICGGISESIQNSLNGKNITVLSWITGEAKNALQLFLQHRLVPGAMLCPGRRRRRWRFCAQPDKAQRNGKNQRTDKQKGGV